MKNKEIKQLSLKDSEKKLKELKFELVKVKKDSGKTGSSKAKNIRKMIARIHTFNKSKMEEKEPIKEVLKK